MALPANKTKNELITIKFKKLKMQYDKLFYKYKELQQEQAGLKIELEQIKKVNKNLVAKYSSEEKNESILVHENSVIRAKIQQLHRNSISSPKTIIHEKEYEVESIVKHRRKNRLIQYLVRWKNYPPDQDTWQLESDLSCPKILNTYKKLKKL